MGTLFSVVHPYIHDIAPSCDSLLLLLGQYQAFRIVILISAIWHCNIAECIKFMVKLMLNIWTFSWGKVQNKVLDRGQN